MNSYPSSDSQPDSPLYYRYGRRTRIGLLVLLCVAVLFAGGVLFLKYKLAGLRETVQTRAESFVGARLHVGAVRVNGLRGICINDLEAHMEIPQGPTIEAKVPQADIYIDLVDLLYGHMTINRIQVDRARVLISRPPGSQWLKGETLSLPSDRSGLAQGGYPFRVVGRDCSLEIRNVVGETNLEIAGLAFDVSRLKDASDIAARISGALGGVAAKQVAVNARYTSPQDFDLRIQCGEITADDVNVFLPAARHVIQTGKVSPSIRVAGYPNRTLVVALEAPFDGVALRDQPAFFQPASGSLTALANYNIDQHLFTITMAKAQSEQLAGRLEGTISFAESAPVLDLYLEADQLPVRAALESFIQGREPAFGEFAVELQEPYQIGMRLQGTPETPVLIAEASVTKGEIAFKPKDKRLPTADLEFGQLQMLWNSGGTAPQGRLAITDGVITHAASKTRAEKISGTLLLANNALVLEPISGQITGNAVVGRARYDLAKHTGEFTLGGNVSKLEETPLGGGIKSLYVAGMANVQCSGQVSPNHYQFTLSGDATQAQINFEWWLRKPVGTGAVFKEVTVDVRPKKSISIAAAATVDASELRGTFDLVHNGQKFRLQRFRLDSDHLDVPSAGKCLWVPYAITGSVADNGFYERNLVAGPAGASIVTFGLSVDEISFLPKGCEAPVYCRKGRLDGQLDNRNPEDRKANMTVTVEAGSLPPFGRRWFLPLRPDDPDEAAEYAPWPRKWTYTVKAGALEMPPWQGKEFSCEAFDDSAETNLRRFAAEIDGGRLEGSYRFEKGPNLAELTARWRNIPAVYLIRHLKFPEMLAGRATGEVSYRVDYDDPDTLKGAGNFDILDGEFSADVLREQFAQQLNGDTASFPPSLKFAQLKSEVELEGDTVRTPELLLRAPGITVSGDGEYVIDGDMNYTLKVSIKPETARHMPVLLKSFNIDGHRLTQNNVELALDIKGPTFNPTGAVVGLPSVGVTLISGAGEVASEAIRIIDAPRQILLDLFKIGGGIVGAAR